MVMVAGRAREDILSPGPEITTWLLSLTRHLKGDPAGHTQHGHQCDPYLSHIAKIYASRDINNARCFQRLR
ncbi:hypothetical protein E2C01_092168 [Portunus trituberculatus]|uniref:Uncharacterized protein n=1 Tax=Portunus trituberculatus TaxID=210409 RepID=A0A5B7JUR6_PORTR|nr:hypothetical protein [Portunus trituberculatus]